MKKIIGKLLFITFSLLVSYNLRSQIGGVGTYRFLELSNSARIAALGGKNISLNDSDLNLCYYNPSLLSAASDNNLTFSGTALFAGSGFGYAGYAKHVDSIGTFAVGMFYIDYGTFRNADNTGERFGNFYAREYALHLSYSRNIDSFFRVGISVKPLYSILERYSSTGLATDLGAVYTSRDGLFSAGLTFRDFGFQFKTYTQNNREPLAYEILLGISKKLAHAPFRISITAQNIQKLKLDYNTDDESTKTNSYETVQPSKLEKFGDNILRHLLFGLEFLPSKSFYIAAAYNYERRKKMALEDAPGSVGFSFGAGLRLKRLSISYGRLIYHAAGGSNHFSILVNLSKAYRK